ncbi:MAG: hypothetical protein L0Z53_26245 [Acidobacteriales bacterium]|nr:hypothetical protein [Terriglobales bacterium]
MDLSEKSLPRRPRVLHGPHRLRMSGVAARPSLPQGEVAPTVVAGDAETVTETVEISVELIPLDEPK